MTGIANPLERGSLFLADTVPPFYLYAQDPRGEG